MADRVRGWIRAAASSTLATSLAARVTLLRYLGVGGLVGVMDVGMLHLLLVARVDRFAATTASYLVMGVALHFTLSKYVTFRNRERATLPLQIRTYAIVTGLCYLSTIAIVEAVARSGGSPEIGKLLAIAVNVPLAFVCNRTFTFAAREGARPNEPGGTRHPSAEA